MFQRFISELQTALARLPLEDREKISAYYTELYFDKKDRGLREEDIVISFGSVSLIAERILKERADRAFEASNAYTTPIPTVLSREPINKSYVSEPYTKVEPKVSSNENNTNSCKSKPSNSIPNTQYQNPTQPNYVYVPPTKDVSVFDLVLSWILIIPLIGLMIGSVLTEIALVIATIGVIIFAIFNAEIYALFGAALVLLGISLIVSGIGKYIHKIVKVCLKNIKA